MQRKARLSEMTVRAGLSADMEAMDKMIDEIGRQLI